MCIRDSCKDNADSSCKRAIANFAKLFRNSSNANECKDTDPVYKESQDMLRSCPREY